MMTHLYQIDDTGACHVTNQGIIELAYQDKLQDALFVWQDAAQQQAYERTCEMLDVWPFRTQVPHTQDRTWFTPPEYANINLDQYVLQRCTTEEERERAQTELAIIHELHAECIFLHLIYLVDVWRKQNLVWGIGRGSSVSCFVLYVIGINKINPLLYDLDHREFFKVG